MCSVVVLLLFLAILLPVPEWDHLAELHGDTLMDDVADGW